MTLKYLENKNKTQIYLTSVMFNYFWLLVEFRHLVFFLICFSFVNYVCVKMPQIPKIYFFGPGMLFPGTGAGQCLYMHEPVSGAFCTNLWHPSDHRSSKRKEEERKSMISLLKHAKKKRWYLWLKKVHVTGTSNILDYVRHVKSCHWTTLIIVFLVMLSHALEKLSSLSSLSC